MRRPGGGSPGVVDVLRQEIVSLVLPPGTVLSRTELQDRFGLSSTPIRDALIRLQEEGLVDIFPQHATQVSLIDLSLARQAQFLRRACEAEVVRQLASAPDPALVARLRALVRRQKAFASLGDYEAFTAADRDFHHALHVAAGVEQVWLVVQRQRGHMDRLRRLNLPVKGKVREIVREHGLIVDAIEAGRPGDAEAALRGHLSRSLDFVGKLRAAHPGYFKP
jgi:GntR family transcriptional regulator, rspAB operon transcriptional repressor